jgi:hypothetical protein
LLGYYHVSLTGRSLFLLITYHSSLITSSQSSASKINL